VPTAGGHHVGGRLGGACDPPALPAGRQPASACKLIIPARRNAPDLRTHDGCEWPYLLDGQLRLILGDRDIVLQPGEAAEFGTRVPHWFGGAGPGPVELLSMFGPQGERAHLRARPALAHGQESGGT